MFYQMTPHTVWAIQSVISNFSVTPTKVKKEKKDENFQSPRKIQSINILRRKRTQVKF